MALAYVTEKTSVVRVTVLGAPYTLIYLSTSIYPGHTAGILDTTGNPNIATQPILISTVFGQKFYDGTFSTLITEPNGAKTITSLTSTTWQVLNNVGFFTSLSNAYLNQITGTNLFATSISSTQGFVSSITARTVQVSRSLILQGNAVITGNLVVQGTVTILSSLTVNGNVNLSTSLITGGAATFQSTVYVRDALTVDGGVSTLGNATIDQDLYVNKSVNVFQALVPNYLSVQTLTMNEMNLAGGIQVAGDTQIGSSLQLYNTLFVGGIGTIENNVNVISTTQVAGKINVLSNAYISSLNITGYLSTLGNTFVSGITTFRDSFSTNGDLNILASTLVKVHTAVQGNVDNIQDITGLRSVYIGGNAYFSSLTVSSILDIRGTLFVRNSAVISGALSIYSTIAVGKDLYATQGATSILGELYTDKNLDVTNNFSDLDFFFLGGKTSTTGSVTGIQTATVYNTISTSYLRALGGVEVVGELYVRQVLSVATLGAPIGLILSTLTVSNTFYGNQGTVPYLIANSFPTKMFVGTGRPGTQDLYVTDELQIRNKLTQVGVPYSSRKDYSANIYTTSSFVAPYLPSTAMIGTVTPGVYLGIGLSTTFQTILSTANMSAELITASSITGKHIGDGSRLSNIGGYQSSIFTSSVTVNNIYAPQLYASSLITNIGYVDNDITLRRTTFQPTANIWFAGGDDTTMNGNIQLSYDTSNWNKAESVNFQYYVKGVTGNGNVGNPFFVATGADSLTLNTIQWSQNATNWFAIASGGFSNGLNSQNIGNSVAYLSTQTINRWVAVGLDATSRSTTIQYSTDGINWLTTANGFAYEGVAVRASPSGLMASGFDNSNDSNLDPPFGIGAFKYSANGITWSNSVFAEIPPPYPLVVSFTFVDVRWWGIDRVGDLFYSGDVSGSEWYVAGYTGQPTTTDIYYANGLLLVVGGNRISYSTEPFFTENWAPVVTEFPITVSFQSVYYNSNQRLWVAGAASSNTLETLWNSSDGIIWSPIVEGGFSTALLAFGAGYGITTVSTATKNVVIASGTGSITGTTILSPQILTLSSLLVSNSWTTRNSLITTSTWNPSVRAVAYNESATYKFVGVGNSRIPEETIGRAFTENGPWYPAIQGGFSTTGYGVVNYNNNIWVAVGDDLVSTNTIQYSEGGANWFGTNSNIGGNVLREGGRAITLGDVAGSAAALLAVGKDTLDINTIGNSSNGYDWSPSISGGFNQQGNGITVGTTTGSNIYLAVGQDTNTLKTIQFSRNGLSWSNILTGGFTLGGYGVAYGDLSGTDMFVAVGNVNNTTQSAVSYSIQYSIDASNWLPTTSAFTKQGYGVTYNHASNLWFAVGEDINGNSALTIKYSGNGSNWSNIVTDNGFKSQFSYGTAYSLYSQQIDTTEIASYMIFPNITVYERSQPLLIQNPTIRLQPSSIYLNESINIDLSNNVTIGGDIPYPTADLTVRGDFYTSSLIYKGNVANQTALIVSSLVASTLFGTNNMIAKTIETPSLFIGPGCNTLAANFANTIQFFEASPSASIPPQNSVININDTLYVGLSNQVLPTASNIQTIGIGVSTSDYALDVSGSVGTSSFIGTYIESLKPTTVDGLQNIYFIGSNLTIHGGDPELVTGINTIYTQPSSILFNKIVTANLSTARMGLYTTNPQYSFDVRTQGIVDTVNTSLLVSGAFFLTLQTI
jgi:hypothetical protein